MDQPETRLVEILVKSMVWPQTVESILRDYPDQQFLCINEEGLYFVSCVTVRPEGERTYGLKKNCRQGVAFVTDTATGNSIPVDKLARMWALEQWAEDKEAPKSHLLTAGTPMKRVG